VRGIKRAVAHVTAHPEQLPLEFPDRRRAAGAWTPEVVISRMAGYVMTRNAESEVQRARLAHAVGVARVAEFMPPDPPVAVMVPDGLDLADLTADVLALAADADAPVRLDVPAAAAVGRFGPLAPARAVASAFADAARPHASPARPWRSLASPRLTRRSAPTTGWCRARGPPAAGPCSRTIRTGPCACRRCR